MRDRYYYRSLIATLLFFVAVLSSFVGFILVTGVIGFVFLLFIISGALCYFYGVFEKSEDRMKGNSRSE